MNLLPDHNAPPGDAIEEADDVETFKNHLVRKRRDTDPRYREADLAALSAVQASRPLKPPSGRPPLRTTRAAELALAEEERSGIAGDFMAVGPGGMYRKRGRPAGGYALTKREDGRAGQKRR